MDNAQIIALKDEALNRRAIVENNIETLRRTANEMQNELNKMAGELLVIDGELNAYEKILSCGDGAADPKLDSNRGSA